MNSSALSGGLKLFFFSDAADKFGIDVRRNFVHKNVKQFLTVFLEVISIIRREFSTTKPVERICRAARR